MGKNLNQTSARTLYNLIVEMNKAFKKGSGEIALKSGDLGRDFADLIVKVTGLVRDTREEISRANFIHDDRVGTLINRLNEIQQVLINALSTRGTAGTSGPLVSEVITERALSIAEQIENAGISNAPPPTREIMVGETEALISEVKDWDLEEYAKQTLLIHLTNVTRIVQAADTYSASELRLQVKAIIADFASEFAAMDKKHQTKLERLVMWGRRGFFAGTILLGLTSDVTSITAALPSPPKMITKG